jgi:hypothetical protein
VPKRKVSFYNPFVYTATATADKVLEENSPKKVEQASPLPLKDNEEKALTEEDKTGSAEEELPPPPPELRK